MGQEQLRDAMTAQDCRMLHVVREVCCCPQTAIDSQNFVSVDERSQSEQRVRSGQSWCCGQCAEDFRKATRLLFDQKQDLCSAHVVRGMEYSAATAG